jgi:integrase
MAIVRARLNELRAFRHAPATVKAYESDWRHFEAWCGKHALTALPSTPQTLAMYISYLVPLRRHSTLGRRVAAIVWKHHEQDLAAPDTPLVRSVLQGAGRRNNTPQNQKAAMTIEELRTVTIPLADQDGAKPTRDRAIMLLGFAGAYRRSELAALRLADIDLRDDHVTVRIWRSKTDQKGKGRVLVIPRAKCADICPVVALNNWIALRGSWPGPLFCLVGRNSGEVLRKPMDGNGIYYMLRCAVARAGLDASRFGGHSLRAGAVTAAAAAGANVFDIMSLSGHKSYDNVARYVRPAQPNYALRAVL